ncbi:hypothetical protein BDN72DRAFT_844850 [Pluteus cervinus]|uniref:Uncharacterized protein n=1 Tax=Pluteus cervinus TaxID=181527 RepID=A0ACD3AKK9_9AGAR|nr:hypothetical protein BDN72DRAFT_844850 [Pluteus cervinus]
MTAFQDSDVRLVSDKPFEVFYPHEYSQTVADAQKVQMSASEMDVILNDIFKHPSLDLGSIFDHVRNTDLILPSDDIKAVQTLITDCKTEITTLHTKIKDLIPSILAITRDFTETSCRLVQKSRQIRLAEYILSRPKHLPQDVLEQIFLACWELQEFTAKLTSNSVPLQLASVSHRWRAIVLGMPVLWSNIRIKWPSSIPKATAWFNRCRTMPILTLDLSAHRITSSQLDELLEFIKTSSSPPIRLRKLELDILQADMAKKAWDTLLNGHPSEDLEELVIRDSHQPDPIPKSVKRLYLHNPPASWVHSHPPPGLTVLCVTMVDVYIHWNMVESILFHCTNLQRLTLRTTESGLQPQNTDRLGSLITPTILENLIYLGLSNDSNGTDHLPKDFLGNFHFPNLRVLEYKVESGGSTRPAWLIAHPLLANIHRLTMQIEPEVSEEDFKAILSRGSSLEEFSICCTKTSFPNLFGILSGSSNSSDMGLLLPSLKSLHLGGWEQSSMDTHTTALIEVIQAWSPSIRGEEHCLTHLTFQSWYDESDSPTQIIIEDKLREANPSLEIKAIRYTTTFLLANIPLLFTTYPLPFNGVKNHEVMDVVGVEEGKGKWEWKAGTGHIYDVV